MAIRLVATDMDGTLLDSRKNHPPDFADWVKAHPEIRVVAASGRQYRTLREEFPEISERLIYIAENGGLVFEKGEVLYRNPIDTEDLRRALNTVFRNPGVYPVLCGEKGAFIGDSYTEEAVRNVKMYYHELQTVPDLYEVITRDRFVKMALFCEGDRAFEIEGRFQEISPRIRTVISGKEWIDLSNSDVNKGAGIRAIQERLGIAPEECMAFGDYMNDLELLRNCAESYAMANACPEIKTAAKYETLSNDEDGVMVVLRRELP